MFGFWHGSLLVDAFFLLQGQLADHHSFLLFLKRGRIIFKRTEHPVED